MDAGQPPHYGQPPGYSQPPHQPHPGYAPQPQPQWPQQGYWQQGQQQGGMMNAGDFARRHIRTPETKEFFKTSEFAVFVLATAAVLVASAIDNGFDAFEVWMLVTALSIGYMLSRGLSKAGARRDYPDQDRSASDDRAA